MLKVINPYDQSVYREMAFDGPDEREGKIRLASETFRRWRRVPLLERIAVIRQ